MSDDFTHGEAPPVADAAAAPPPPPLPADRAIVCFACEDYWYHPKRSRRHYMERLAARGWRVLFVNSIGLRAPSRANPDFWMRVKRKARSWARWLRRPDPATWPTLYVASPIALPFHQHAWARALNRVALRLQLRLMMALAGIRRPVAWFGQPVMVELRGRLGERLAILHNSDRYDAYKGKLDADAGDRERGDYVTEAWYRLHDACDLVINASAKLADDSRARNPHSYYLPQGIDADHFGRARTDPSLAVPAALAAIPRPRVGYVGQIEMLVDQALVERIARERPDWHQVFVGPPSHEVEELLARCPPNVHFLGFVPYAEVPSMMRGFDVATMPMVVDDLMDNMNALKLREYLLAGRPTVCIPHAEVRDNGGNPILFVPRATHDAFLAALDEAMAASRELLDPDTMAWRAGSALAEAARPHVEEMARGTWEARTDELERIIARHLATKGA